VRRVLFVVCTVLLLTALFEGLSALFWTQYGASRISYHERADLNAIPFGQYDEDWRNSGLKSDVDLGWVMDLQHPSISPNGLRRDTLVYAETPVSAYGDSFVYGADVKNDQTFPHYLAEYFGSGVANFGVSGYGPDQAILRLERHLSLGQRPKVVVLGMPGENIARVVNIYRKLYIPLEHPELAKPIFVEHEGAWQIVNVMKVQGELEDMGRRVAALVRRYDYWHVQNALRPKFSFPYSLATLTALRFFTIDVVRWQDLYESPRARKDMTYLLERFVDLSRRYNFLPVFVVVPMPEDLRNINNGGRSFFDEFLEHTSKKFGDQLLVVDVLADKLDFDRFHVHPYSGHASAYGNQKIAEAIYGKISAVKPKLAGRRN